MQSPNSHLSGNIDNFGPALRAISKRLGEEGVSLDSISAQLRALQVQHQLLAPAGVRVQMGPLDGMARLISLPFTRSDVASTQDKSGSSVAPVTIYLALVEFLSRLELPRQVQICLQDQTEHGIERDAEPWPVHVNQAFVLDLNPALPPGYVALRQDALAPAICRFEINLSRKSGSERARTTDLIQLAAHVIISFNQTLSRRVDPLNPAKIELTAISSSGSGSLTPESVSLAGQVCSVYEANLDNVLFLLKREIATAVEQEDVEIEFSHSLLSKALGNNPDCLRILRIACEASVGPSRIVDLEFVNKDYAWLAQYLQHCPTAVLHAGIANAEDASSRRTASLDEALLTPFRALASLALS